LNIKQLQQLKDLITLDTGLISDNHFGHPKVFNIFEPIRKAYTESEGLSTLEDFENLMIRNWNGAKCDTLLHLGDFCINKRKKGQTEINIKNASDRLNSKDILIRGNHDSADTSVYLENGWGFVIEQPVILIDGELGVMSGTPQFANCIIIDINDYRIMFSHFGLFQDDPRSETKYKEAYDFLKNLYKEFHCDINIHGHSHSEGVNSKISFNCSVEAINFSPIRLKNILEKERSNG
jgi:calcineurin-like phosphoesterase family protein